MNITALHSLIGQQGLLRVESMQVRCTVLDARSTFGRVQVQVQVGENHPRWVSLDRFTKDLPK